MKVFAGILLLFCFSSLFSQNLKINEFLARNYSSFSDEYDEFDDWIEIANLSDSDINLNGYSVTDDLTLKNKCILFSNENQLVVPAGGFLILWADDEVFQGNRHLNFKLNGEGGVIAIFSPSLQLIDSVSYSLQRGDVSMGRLISDNTVWKYFDQPTPDFQNNSPYYNGFVKDPVFTRTSGFFTSSVQVPVFSVQNEASVFYTLDHSVPSDLSLPYSGPVQLTDTRVIRAFASREHFIGSNIISHLYIRGEKFSLPVLAMITDSSNLFGPGGIYTLYEEDLEKPGQIKYIEEGTMVSESNAGVSIQGASSTFMPKKSFRLYFRKKYGNSEWMYPLFDKPSVTGFEKLVLKSGYDDDVTTPTGTLLRDALALELWKKTGGLPQLSSWVILYLNNRYWGIYNLRESIDENFIRAHTGMENFDLVRLRNEGPDSVYGTLGDWKTMFDFLKNNDISNDENYDHLAEMLDMDDFANLLAFVQCTNYYSWAWGVSMFKESDETVAKWKYSIWDADRAFNNVEWNGFAGAWDDVGSYKWANIFPKKITENQAFQQKYTSRIYELINTVFKPENAIAVLDSLYQIIDPEMAGEFKRWNPQNKVWEQNVEAIRDFLRRRPDIVLAQMQEYFGFSGEWSPLNSRVFADVFPNPFKDVLNIRLHLLQQEDIEISLIDLNGRIVHVLYKGQAADKEFTVSWKSGSLKSGFYILKISDSHSVQYLKILHSD